MNIYSIFDVKSGLYSLPMLWLNDALAVRAFDNAVQDDESQLSRNPGDYSLFCLGYFDDKSGSIEASSPIKITNGVESISRANQRVTLVPELKESANG